MSGAFKLKQEGVLGYTSGVEVIQRLLFLPLTIPKRINISANEPRSALFLQSSDGEIFGVVSQVVFKRSVIASLVMSVSGVVMMGVSAPSTASLLPIVVVAVMIAVLMRMVMVPVSVVVSPPPRAFFGCNGDRRQ